MSDDKTFLYFAYGSNLSSDRIRISNPSAEAVGPAMLQDYILDFNYHSKRWHGTPATIKEESGSQVYGVLWRLHLDHLATLDQQEGVSDQVYRRFQVEVSLMNRCTDCEKVSAFTYQLQPERCQSVGDEKRPSKVYMNVILSGARENKLPDFYIKKLESIEHNGFDGEVEFQLPLHIRK